MKKIFTTKPQGFVKRLFTFALLCVISAFGALGFVGCGGNENRIRINEVTHSIFYAPLYAAINLGYFEDEGLEITLTNGQSSQVSMNALLAGSADIILAGPETAVQVATQNPKTLPIIFGQLTKRDGSFLVSRNNETDFEYSSLAGKHVIAGRRAGMPAMTLQYVLEEAGLTLGDNTNDGKVYFDLSVPFANTIPTFQGGYGDYVTMFEPAASDFVEQGLGYIVATVGEAGGECPYTCFMAKQKYINKNGEKLEKFLRAVQKGYEYLISASLEDAAASLAPSFYGIASMNSIKKSITSYINADAWCETPVMSESAFTRLLDVIENAGELDERVPFSKIVDNSIANLIITA